MKKFLYAWLIVSIAGLPVFSFRLGAQPGIVKANGIRIAYESFGKTSDEPVIMIQGTGATMLHYPEEMCQKLAKKGFRVIRFDNRDIGLSEKLDSLGQPNWAAIFPYIKKCDPAPLPYTLLDMAKDVTGLMDALGIRKAHIVGVSMGAAIAQIMAINFPDRLLSLTSGSSSAGNPDMPVPEGKALTVMSTPAPKTTDRDSLADYLVGVYKALGAVDNDKVLRDRALGHIARSWDPDAVNRQIAAVLIAENCDRRKDLAGIRIPTVVIHGDADPLVTLAAGRQVAESIPGSRFCIIKGMGHDLSLKFIDEIIQSMLPTLRNHNVK
jgi:pimeloyl-ACP methyl ester carboxylesterase